MTRPSSVTPNIQSTIVIRTQPAGPGGIMRSIADLKKCADHHLSSYMDPTGPFAFNTYDRLALPRLVPHQAIFDPFAPIALREASRCMSMCTA
jgi:hypothetical protein